MRHASLVRLIVLALGLAALLGGVKGWAPLGLSGGRLF